MNRFLTACALAALFVGTPFSFAADTAPAADAVPPASTAPVPAGEYKLDKSHATLLFRVSHLGFSNYTARFSRFDAQLKFDPRNFAASSVTVTVDPRSIDADGAPEGFMATLAGAQWLDADKFSQITYRSTKVERAGRNGMRINGELTLRGVTRPVTLNATYNGGYAGHPFDPSARIGFSAKGTLKRSEFGVSVGIPAPGSNMGVSDEVEFIIESEFLGPPLPKTP